MTDILLALDMISGGIISGICICRANAMGKSTDWKIRAGYVLLACGGCSLLLAPLFREGASPEWTQTISHIGLALLLMAGRRGCCPSQSNTGRVQQHPG